MAMNQSELLKEVQKLEDEGYVIFLKWDGERSRRKKTLAISKPGTDLFVRRDSDDMWASLESALREVRDTEPTRAEQDSGGQPATRPEST